MRALASGMGHDQNARRQNEWRERHGKKGSPTPLFKTDRSTEAHVPDALNYALPPDEHDPNDPVAVDQAVRTRMLVDELAKRREMPARVA